MDEDGARDAFINLLAHSCLSQRRCDQLPGDIANRIHEKSNTWILKSAGEIKQQRRGYPIRQSVGAASLLPR